VRPGQIQQWQEQDGLEADLLLIDPAVIQPNTTTFQQATMALLRLEEWPNCFKMEAEELASWNLLTSLLRRELSQPEPSTLSVRIDACNYVKRKPYATKLKQKKPSIKFPSTKKR